MDRHQNPKRRRKIYTVVMGICILIMIAAGVYAVNDIFWYHNAKQASEIVTRKVVRTVKTRQRIDKNLLRRIDFKALWQMNTDAKRWLFVPQTKINAPVLDEPKVGSYFYSLRGLNKRYNYCGSFLVPKAPNDSEGHKVDDGHLFILGHYMDGSRDEWQFSKLPSRWGTKAGANKYPYVYLYYPNHAERWRVWMALDATGSDMIYDIPTKIGSNEYAAMLTHAKKLARYRQNLHVTKEMPTLFMSTCNRSKTGAWIRFVLVSVLDAKYDYQSQTYTSETLKLERKN